MQFDLNGHTYSNTKMDVPTQAEFMRRIGPALPHMAEPMTAFSKLSSEDFHWIMKTCLLKTQRKNMDMFTAVATTGGEYGYQLMFDDIDLIEMFGIVKESVTEMLTRLFPSAGTKESNSQPTPA